MSSEALESQHFRPQRSWVWALSAFLCCWPISCSEATPSVSQASKREAIEEMIARFPAKILAAPTLRPEALLQQDPAPLMVDVRSAEERAVSQIPNAISLDDYLRPGAERQAAVLYCTIGYRSAKTALELKAKGLEVRNLRGGILAWLLAGGNLVGPDGQPSFKVHVYGSKWNLLPAPYEGVW